MIEKDSIAENKKLKEELEKYRRLEIELSTEIELLREGIIDSQADLSRSDFLGGQWRSRPLSHFEKMTLADLSTSANFQKMSLWFEDFFCSSHTLRWEHEPSARAHFYGVKYSVLYFTCKSGRKWCKTRS